MAHGRRIDKSYGDISYKYKYEYMRAEVHRVECRGAIDIGIKLLLKYSTKDFWSSAIKNAEANSIRTLSANNVRFEVRGGAAVSEGGEVRVPERREIQKSDPVCPVDEATERRLTMDPQVRSTLELYWLSLLLPVLAKIENETRWSRH